MPEPNNEVKTKVTFSSEQQIKVDELIRESMGRAGNEARATTARLEAEMITLRSELQAAKDVTAATDDVAKAKDAEIEKARKETVALRKENAIRQAAETHGFFNSAQVAKLTEQDVKWDAGKQKFIVVDESGAERLGIDGNPITLDALYKDFASRNPHLVRSSVLTGIGSREAQQPPQRTVGEKEKLAKLFGRGSDGKAANDIAISDPNEYKRLRHLAKRDGLI